MGQKFSTFLDQSFDTSRIADRRDKSGDRASWANSSADANTQIDSPQFVQAQGESFPNDLRAKLSVAVKYWERVACSLPIQQADGLDWPAQLNAADRTEVHGFI